VIALGLTMRIVWRLTRRITPATISQICSLDDDQPFDPRTTPCRHLGVVANTFWQLPEVLRSDSPHAFVAQGPEAARITAPSPLEVPHGLDSPVVCRQVSSSHSGPAQVSPMMLVSHSARRVQLSFPLGIMWPLRPTLMR
jgi:aminoglycoside 3-N-acetyltransferase